MVCHGTSTACLGESGERFKDHVSQALRQHKLYEVCLDKTEGWKQGFPVKRVAFAGPRRGHPTLLVLFLLVVVVVGVGDVIKGCWLLVVVVGCG